MESKIHDGRLTMQGCELMDHDIPAVLDYASHYTGNINTVNFSNNYIGANGAEKIASFISSRGTIVIIDLNNNFIGTQGAMALAKITEPHDVYIDLRVAHNFIEPDGIEALATANNGIEQLDVSFNHLDKKALNALMSNTRMISFGLQGDNIGVDEAALIASHQNEGEFTCFDLGFNPLGQAGAKILANDHNNFWISESYIADNIGDAGAIAYANYPSNQDALDLMIWNDSISDIGAEALANSSNFVTLSLEYNHIGDPGALALANDQTLQGLDVCNNPISDVGWKALKANKHIQLADCNSSDDALPWMCFGPHSGLMHNPKLGSRFQ